MYTTHGGTLVVSERLSNNSGCVSVCVSSYIGSVTPWWVGRPCRLGRGGEEGDDVFVAHRRIRRVGVDARVRVGLHERKSAVLGRRQLGHGSVGVSLCAHLPRV